MSRSPLCGNLTGGISSPFRLRVSIYSMIKFLTRYCLRNILRFLGKTTKIFYRGLTLRRHALRLNLRSRENYGNILHFRAETAHKCRNILRGPKRRRSPDAGLNRGLPPITRISLIPPAKEQVRLLSALACHIAQSLVAFNAKPGFFREPR